MAEDFLAAAKQACATLCRACRSIPPAAVRIERLHVLKQRGRNAFFSSWSLPPDPSPMRAFLLTSCCSYCADTSSCLARDVSVTHVKLKEGCIPPPQPSKQAIPLGFLAASSNSCQRFPHNGCQDRGPSHKRMANVPLRLAAFGLGAGNSWPALEDVKETGRA